MADHVYKYLIVGAGNAAGYAARQFVQTGVQRDTLCLVGDEPVLPYERPALSKAFLVNPNVRLPGFHTCVGGGGDRQTPDWYDSNAIATITGHKVVSLDAVAKRVVLDDGRSALATDALILATGASPIYLTRTPGNALSGIHYLRNNHQALALADALAAARDKHVAVIGGGYIGMEVCAAAVTLGCNVTMIFPESHMMSRLFTEDIAKPYESFYASKGVKFIKDGALAKEFLPDQSGDAVRAVLVGHGDENPTEEISASLVVVGVGARPETALLKSQVDIDAQGGVVVNSSLESSVPGVYAIGDIATFPLKMYGDRAARVEHVQNCRESATHAVNAIMKGDNNPYDYLPYFYSRVFHLSWQFFGDNVGECLVIDGLTGKLNEWTAESGEPHPQMLAIWVDDTGILAGVFMESPSTEQTADMKRVARERPTVDVEAFRKCDSVSVGWNVILKTM